ncbi:MAG: hypothetical protein AAFN74_13480 [Myxococcota bacterium]
MIRWILAALMAVSVSAGTRAQAQETEFRDLVDDGMKSYKARRYNEAIRSFEAAFALKPEPELVYNVARAYEKSLNSRKALESYERFLRLQGTTADLRAKALASVEALKSEQQARARASRRTLPSAPAPTAKAAPAARPMQPPSIEVQAEPASKNRTLEWTLVGGGAALAVTGGVFAVLAALDNSDFNDKESSGTATQAELQDIKDSVEQNALVADILVPVGLIAAGVGAALFLVDDDDDGDFSFSPLVTTDGGGMAMGGRF